MELTIERMGRLQINKGARAKMALNIHFPVLASTHNKNDSSEHKGCPLFLDLLGVSLSYTTYEKYSKRKI
jgi:hypothetical protein